MATIPLSDLRQHIRALRADSAARAELDVATPSKQQLLALLQGAEDWFNLPATRLAAKSAMEAEAGIAISNTLAKKVFKVFMQFKFGRE